MGLGLLLFLRSRVFHFFFIPVVTLLKDIGKIFFRQILSYGIRGEFPDFLGGFGETVVAGESRRFFEHLL